jgi:hypothetical protein
MNIYELSGNEHDDNYNLTNSQPGNTVVATTTPFNPLNGFHIAHSWRSYSKSSLALFLYHEKPGMDQTGTEL